MSMYARLPIGGPSGNRYPAAPIATPSSRSRGLSELSKQAFVFVQLWSQKVAKLTQLIQDFHNPSIETRFIENSFNHQRDPDIFDQVYECISFAFTGDRNKDNGKKIIDRGFPLFFLARDRQGSYLPDLILEYYQQQHDAQRTKGELAKLASLWYAYKNAEERGSNSFEVIILKGQLETAFDALSEKAKGMLCKKIWQLAQEPNILHFGFKEIREDFSRLVNYRGVNPVDLCLGELENEINRPFSLSAPEGLRLCIRQDEPSSIFDENLKIYYLHALNQALNDGSLSNRDLFAKFERIHPDLKTMIYQIVWMACYKPEGPENLNFAQDRLREDMRLLLRMHNASGEGILLQLIVHHQNKLALRRLDREVETFSIEGGRQASNPSELLRKFDALSPLAKGTLAGKIWYRDGGHSDPNYGGWNYGDNTIKANPLCLFSARGSHPSVIQEYRNELQDKFRQADSRLLGDLNGKMTLQDAPYDCDPYRLEAEYEGAALRVVFVTAEFAGIVGVGGLAPALDGMVRGFGAENARIIMPLYYNGPIAKATLQSMREANGKYRVYGVGAQLRIMKLNLRGVRCYFIDAPELFGISNIYEEKPYNLRQRRWAIFQKAAAELSYQFSKKEHPFEVVHVHDSQTALVPNYIAAQHPEEYMAGTTPATVYTFHNTLEQMWYNDHDSMQIFRETGLRDKPVNSFVEALSTADMVTTVSRTYAKETQTDNPDFANGLHRPIKVAAAKGKLVGIVNGNSNGWDPAQDVQLANWRSVVKPGEVIDLRISPNMDPLEMAAKISRVQLEICTLLRSRPVNAPDYADLDPTLPIIMYVGRYDTNQKGINKLPMIMDQALASGAQFVCVGIVPDEDAKGILQGMKNKAKERMNRGVLILEDEKVEGKFRFQGEYGSLLRLACSLAIMPSKYEPCGLVQGEFHRFGIPVLATKTGGFPDTLKTDGQGKNGYLFERKPVWNSDEQNAEIETTLAVAIDEAKQRQIVLYGNVEAQIKEQMEAKQIIMGSAIHSTWTETPDGSPSASRLYRRVYVRALKNRQTRGTIMTDLKIVEIR